MAENEDGLTLEDLVRTTGVPARTIRYYITRRLLSGPTTRGKGASYTEDHLARLRLIRRLSERHVPLTEIRERLAHLAPMEVRALLLEEDHQDAELKRMDMEQHTISQSVSLCRAWAGTGSAAGNARGDVARATFTARRAVRGSLSGAPAIEGT